MYVKGSMALTAQCFQCLSSSSRRGGGTAIYALLILHFAELMDAANKMWHLMSCELRSSGSCRCRF